MDKIKADIVIENCLELLTCSGDNNYDIGLKNNYYIAIKGEKIAFVGNKEEYIDRVDKLNSKVIDANNKVVLPGFVDSHTHLVFGKDRLEEYIIKLTSNDTSKLKRVGLESSIYSTRNTPYNQMLDESIEKLNRMLLNGTTTVEIKSGYGIDKETELKQLKVIKELKEKGVQSIYSTYLGAHYWDKEMGKTKYIDYMIKEVMPLIKEKNLADYCDVWCDDGYYTKEESRKVLMNAREFGMKSKIHTDCYSDIGGSLLAAEMKMTSADHLNYTTKEAIIKMKEAGVVGVVIPATDYSVSHHRPFNPRPMLDEGMILSIATNLNPGNWMESLQLSIDMACRIHKMTVEEAIKATTYGGAKALDSEDRYGSIEVNKYADIQIWDTDNYKNVVYKHGRNHVQTVIKHGKIVLEKNKIL